MSKVSEAFPNISLFKIIDTFTTPNYEWRIFQSNYDYYMLRKSTTSLGNTELRSQITSYNHVSFDTHCSTHCKFYSSVLQYAISKDNTRIETVEKFEGIPLYSLVLYIGGNNFHYIIQHLELLLRGVAILLSSNKIIHGNLSPECILYNKSNHMIKIIDGHYARLIDEIAVSTDNGYYQCFRQTYYTNPSKKLDKEEAVKEDIRALALILYEAGILPNDKKERTTLLDGCFKSSNGKIDLCKVMKYKCTMLRKHSLQEVLEKLLITSDKASYEEIQRRYPHEVFPHIELLHTILNASNVDENDQKIEEEKQVKLFACVHPGMKVTQIDNNYNYIIESSIYGKFFLKVYSNKEDYDTEKQICLREKERLVSAIPCLLHTVPTQDLELAFEYVGQRITSKVRYNIDDRSTLSNAMACIYHITDSLNKAKIFNFSICTAHIAVGNDWIPKLVNFKQCQVYDNVSFDDNLFIKISNKIDIDYSSPELLKIYISKNSSGAITPNNSMIYSTAKSVVAALLGCYNRVDILNKMYGLAVREDAQIMSEISKRLNNTDSEYLCSYQGTAKIEDVAMALFYIGNNHLLIQSVKAMPPINQNINIEYHNESIIHLCRMLSSQYQERYNVQKLESIAEPPVLNGTGKIGVIDAVGIERQLSLHPREVVISERQKNTSKQEQEKADISLVHCNNLHKTKCPPSLLPKRPNYQPEQVDGSHCLTDLFKHINPNYELYETNLWSTYFSKAASLFVSLTKENHILREAQTLNSIYIPVFQNTNTIYTIKLKRSTKKPSIFEKCEQTEPIEYISGAKFSQCLIDNSPCPKLLMIGGSIDGVSQKCLYKITAKDKVLLSNMSIGRSEFGMASLPNFIAVAGGKCSYSNYNYDILDTVELYDAKNNVWATVEGKMKECRTNPSVVLNNGKLYIIGGFRSIKCFKQNNVHYSSLVDVYCITDYAVKLEKSLNLNDGILNSVDCAYMNVHKDEILLLSSFFITEDKVECTSSSRICISDAAATIKECKLTAHKKKSELTDCRCALFKEGCLFFPQCLNKDIKKLELLIMKP